MAKIKTLKEEMLTGGNSQEHIYPRTTTEAVYTKDNKILQEVLEEVKEGGYLEDGIIVERHLKDQNVTTSKIKDGAVVTEKVGDESITTAKIKEKAITNTKLAEGSVTNDKLVDSSIDNRVMAENAVDTANIINQSITREKLKDGDVSEEKLRNDAVSTRTIIDANVTERKLADAAVTTDKLREEAVTTDKIKEKAVTNSKIAEGTITTDKFDDDLRNAIEAATGLPSDILERFQNMSEDIAELQDTAYPIVPSMVINYLNGNYTIAFSVTSKGEPFVGDTTIVTKTSAKGAAKTLSSVPTSYAVLQSPVESNRETFKLEVSAEGHTTKSTSITRYICYAGGSSSATITSDIIDSMTQYSTTNVSFNPTVKTLNGQYIWIVVPSYLNVSRITSQGFEVTLQAPVPKETPLGTFYAYRTVNTLTEQTWNLIIV